MSVAPNSQWGWVVPNRCGPRTGVQSCPWAGVRGLAINSGGEAISGTPFLSVLGVSCVCVPQRSTPVRPPQPHVELLLLLNSGGRVRLPAPVQAPQPLSCSVSPLPCSHRPVIPCRGTTTVDGAGFGIDRPAELSKEDDEYEAFRKRMMLAYRFRPNPLVHAPPVPHIALAGPLAPHWYLAIHGSEAALLVTEVSLLPHSSCARSHQLPPPPLQPHLSSSFLPKACPFQGCELSCL